MFGMPQSLPVDAWRKGVRAPRARFEENLALKLQDDSFHADISPLLASGYKGHRQPGVGPMFRVSNTCLYPGF